MADPKQLMSFSLSSNHFFSFLLKHKKMDKNLDRSCCGVLEVEMYL
jgi:hypothetical protein